MTALNRVGPERASIVCAPRGRGPDRSCRRNYPEKELLEKSLRKIYKEKDIAGGGVLEAVVQARVRRLHCHALHVLEGLILLLTDTASEESLEISFGVLPSAYPMRS